MMIPAPRKRSRSRVKRVKEGKRTKRIPNGLDKYSILSFNTKVDAYMGLIKDSTATYRRFCGYKFTRRMQDPSTNQNAVNLAWNDGIFWCYQNNFRELPCAAGTKTAHGYKQNGQTVDKEFEKEDQFTTNVLAGNRRIVGGTVVRKYPTNGYLQNDGDQQMPIYQLREFSNTGSDDQQATALLNSAKTIQVPILGVAATNNIHQVSQKIKLCETMCTVAPYSETEDDITASPNMQIRKIGDWQDGLNLNEKMILQEMGQTKLKSQIKFAVRNICLYVPHALDFDAIDASSAFNDGYSDVKGQGQIMNLEQQIMKELFEMEPNIFGPGNKDNSDLKKKINPKFKVMRDWIQIYAFRQDDNPSIVRSGFYHRYNHSQPTVCCTDESVVELPINPDEEYTKVAISPIGLSQKIRDMSVNEGVEFALNSPPLVHTGMMVARPQTGWENDISMMTSRRDGNQVDYGDSDSKVEFHMTAEARGLTQNNMNTGWNLRKNYPALNPLTHRLVWLRIPRFAGTLELEHVNDSNTRPFTHLEDIRRIVNACGTKVQGYAQWNIIRPEKSPSGGTVVPVQARESERGARFEIQCSGYTLPVRKQLAT